jgi:phenylacetic acid degradation operon negative regulatory protein
MELGDDITSWREAETRLRPWHGNYLVAHTAILGRGDRTALSKRKRALELLGFREMEQGFFIRPDNIERDTAAVRHRLQILGLEPECTIFVASDFSKSKEAQIARLWDGKKLNLAYKKMRIQLEKWLQRHEQLSIEAAARESFLLGSEAIRHIVFDPLLPDQFVDTQERHIFFDMVLHFDRIGHRIWQKQYQSAQGLPFTTNITLTKVQ